MSEIRQLSGEDIMFIAGETASVYQHVCLLAPLDTSRQPEFDFDHFRRHCVDRLSQIPHFQWKLHSVPMGMDRPYWVEDEHFSFDHHIKRVALPSPGDRPALCEVANNLYSDHLDHKIPLWEIWFIEGLEGGKHAFLIKFHHCMMDGGGALQVIDFICDFGPEPEKSKSIDNAFSDGVLGRTPSYLEQTTRAWQHMAKLPLDVAKSAVDIIGPKIREQFNGSRKVREEQLQVPSASFNGEISSERGCCFVSLSLDDLRQVKNHFGVSLNDVLLALVSSALRRYLLDHFELPDHPLRSSIPVSLRNDSDEQLGNKVTSTTITLATHLEDPVARLQAISLDSKQAKEKISSGGAGMVELFQVMPPVLVSAVMGSLPSEYAPQIMEANLFVSNMRGATKPMYLAGARMEKMYPMSIIAAGMGINITCISYAGSMDIGLVVAPELVPDHNEIAVCLAAALVEYKAQCGP